MRRPSIHSLVFLVAILFSADLAGASDKNLDDSRRRLSENDATIKSESTSNVIKGQEGRQLFLQYDIPERKNPPATSKNELKFEYKRSWKDKFLNPPLESPVASPTDPSPSSSPTALPTSSPTKTVTYVPGKLTHQQNGLLLSEGLSSRIIATTNQKVPLTNGGLSEEAFHGEPDGAAVFADPDTGGWRYVSNAEMMNNEGGVGAIVFNANGEVVDYSKLLRNTSRNCSGGKTPWNTWVSCEEHRDGKIWQVDPTGTRPPEQTSLSPNVGDFESFAYDIRNSDVPRFFVTEDNRGGALRRFTPSNPNWNNPWNMLHGDGTLEYLALVPHFGNQGDTFGTYYWTTDLNLARSNAESFYRYTEGLDVYENEMFFVSKTEKSLFILNLDGNTYTRFDTNFGLFDGQPDQMKRLIKDGPSNVEISNAFDPNQRTEEPLLYFCEDSGSENGIHARDANGWFYTILESANNSRETSGLAFSPDGKHMYFSFQLQGKIFDVWRDDGLPFYGKTLDVHYHEQQAR